jgi:dolichol-phosphate mannosyltransferase
MARISLILPLGVVAESARDQIAAYQRDLGVAEHTVEVLAIVDPTRLDPSAVADLPCRIIVAAEPGMVAASVAGMREARGDCVLVVDLARGYSSEDLMRVIEPLDERSADLVVGSRRLAVLPGSAPPKQRRPWGLGALSLRAVGSSDPLSGLVGLTGELAQATVFSPVGPYFTLELLAKVEGRRVDVPADVGASPKSAMVSIDAIRHFKRLADDRFGTFSRLMQFCAVGASGMVVDLSCYALFQWIFSRTWLADVRAPMVGGPLALAVAAALAIAIALTWNFSLNRRLTFSYARQGSLVRQYVTYALSNALGIALSFSLRLFLPTRIDFFQRHKLAAAVVGIVTATGVSFSMARWIVFRRRTVDLDASRGESVYVVS